MSEPTDQSVLLEDTIGPVRFITLNRPVRKNALTDELGWAILEGFDRAAHAEHVRAIGLTGAGDAFCSGAGLARAMCADIRIASSAARFHPGYARAATSPDGGLSWTLPQAIGHERTMRFLLEQEMVGADEALALGLSIEVVPAETFDARFRSYCERIAGVAPIAARQTKRLVSRAGALPDLEAHLRDEMSYVFRGLSTDDGREAVRAILEKRAPQFKGR